VDDPAGRRPLTASPASDVGPSPSPAAAPDPSAAAESDPRPGPLGPDGLDATVVLVRHGESTFIAEGRFQGQADSPLTPDGLRQAELVARRLAEPHAAPALPLPTGDLLEIVHSPLSRTAQTAESIGRAIASGGRVVSRRPDPGFLEIHQGIWQGLPRDEIARRFGPELATWRRDPLAGWAPGGESLPEVQARLRPALASLLERLGKDRAPGTHDRPQVPGYRDARPAHPWSIVVGHDGVFKVAMLTLFDLPLARFWMWSMDLCGIAILEFRAGRPVLRAHNLTDHLADLADDHSLGSTSSRSQSGAL
jgi:broad specificity phosphatase PhoE